MLFRERITRQVAGGWWQEAGAAGELGGYTGEWEVGGKAVDCRLTNATRKISNCISFYLKWVALAVEMEVEVEVEVEERQCQCQWQWQAKKDRRVSAAVKRKAGKIPLLAFAPLSIEN